MTLKDFYNELLMAIKGERISPFFAHQEFCYGRMGGKKDNRLALEGLFAKTCGDEKGHFPALYKRPYRYLVKKNAGAKTLEHRSFFDVLTHLSSMHFLFKMPHRPTGFIFVPGRTFGFSCDGILRFVKQGLGSYDALFDDVQTVLF